MESLAREHEEQERREKAGETRRSREDRPAVEGWIRGRLDAQAKNLRDASWFAEERERDKGSEYQISQMVKDEKAPSGFRAVVKASSPYSFEQAMAEAGIESENSPAAINRKALDRKRDAIH